MKLKNDTTGRCAICGKITKDLCKYYTSSGLTGTNTRTTGTFLGQNTTTTNTYANVREAQGFVCKKCRKQNSIRTLLIGLVFLIIFIVSIWAFNSFDSDMITFISVILFIVSPFIILKQFLIGLFGENGSVVIVKYIKSTRGEGTAFTPGEAEKMYRIR